MLSPLEAHFETHAHADVGLAADGDDSGVARGLVAKHERVLDAQEPYHLFCHRRETPRPASARSPRAPATRRSADSCASERLRSEMSWPVAVEERLTRHQPSAPLEPQRGPVGAKIAVLEPNHIFAAEQPRQRVLGPSSVPGMDELNHRPGQDLVGRISERRFDGWIHPLEVPVEPADAEQVEREIEDFLEARLPTRGGAQHPVHRQLTVLPLGAYADADTGLVGCPRGASEQTVEWRGG